MLPNSVILKLAAYANKINASPAAMTRYGIHLFILLINILLLPLYPNFPYYHNILYTAFFQGFSLAFQLLFSEVMVQ